MFYCEHIIMQPNNFFSFFGIYIFSSFSTKSSSIYHLSPYNTLTSAFFIFSITLTTSLFFSLAVFIFSNISTFSSSINTLTKLQIHCTFLPLLFSLVIYLVHLLFPFLFLVYFLRWNQILTGTRPNGLVFCSIFALL